VHPKDPRANGFRLIAADSPTKPTVWTAFEILEKPFEFKDLLHKVRRLLMIVSPLPIRRQWCCD